MEAYRELTEYEYAVITVLLGFVSELEVVDPAQIVECRVRRIAEYADNYGSIEFDSAHSITLPRAWVVIEATATDEDGVPVEAILHARDQIVTELEFVRADGSPLLRRPHPDAFQYAEHHVGD